MAARSVLGGKPVEEIKGQWQSPSLANVWRLADVKDALGQSIGHAHDVRLTGALLAAEGLVQAAHGILVQARASLGLTVMDPPRGEAEGEGGDDSEHKGG